MEGDACRPFGFYGMGEAAGDMVVVAVVRRARTQWLRRDGGLEGHCDTGSQFACDFIPKVTVVSYHKQPVALEANAERMRNGQGARRRELASHGALSTKKALGHALVASVRGRVVVLCSSTGTCAR